MKRRISCVLAVSILAALSTDAIANADIDVLSWRWYRDDLGYYVAVGEIENVGDSNAEFIMLTGTWYSGAGSVVGTSFTFSMLDVIRPGEKSPFKIYLTDSTGDPERAKLQWSWEETNGQPGRDVRVRDISGSYDSSLGCFTVIGEVENLGLRPVEFVMVIITGYDAEGEVVAADFAFSTLERVAAQGTSPFKAYVCDRASEIERYRYIVQYE